MQVAHLVDKFSFRRHFFDRESKARSKKLLSEALKTAKKQLETNTECANLVQEVCHDEGQLAMWHAIFDHENFESSASACEETFETHAHIHDASYDKLHLMKHRWLKAYRSLIDQAPASPTWEHLQIGETHDKSRKWLLGLALKYRAALLAQSQRYDEAIEDFLASFQNFESMPDSGYFVDLMHLSSRTQTLHSIPRDHDCNFWDKTRENAVSIGENLSRKRHFSQHPHASPKAWLKVLESIQCNGPVGPCAEPQRMFVH